MAHQNLDTNQPEQPSITPVVTTETQPEALSPQTPFIPVYKMNQITWFVGILIEILIGFRVFLKMIAANPQSGFANFIYTMSDLFLLPFLGLTATPSANGSVLEVPAIIAMFAYAILFWLIAYFTRLIFK